MKPVPFPEQTIVYAKNQLPFLPLPAYSNAEETISKLQLTWKERFLVLWRGHVWHRQMNYGRPPMAILVQVEYPFLAIETSTERGHIAIHPDHEVLA